MDKNQEKFFQLMERVRVLGKVAPTNLQDVLSKASEELGEANAEFLKLKKVKPTKPGEDPEKGLLDESCDVFLTACDLVLRQASFETVFAIVEKKIFKWESYAAGLNKVQNDATVLKDEVKMPNPSVGMGTWGNYTNLNDYNSNRSDSAKEALNELIRIPCGDNARKYLADMSNLTFFREDIFQSFNPKFLTIALEDVIEIAVMETNKTWRLANKSESMYGSADVDLEEIFTQELNRSLRESSAQPFPEEDEFVNYNEFIKSIKPVGVTYHIISRSFLDVLKNYELKKLED